MAEKKTNDTVKKTVKTVTKVESSKSTAAAATPKYAPKAAQTAASSGDAKTKRILAVVFWVIAIAFEVLALLVFIGKIDLGFISQLALSSGRKQTISTLSQKKTKSNSGCGTTWV